MQEAVWCLVEGRVKLFQLSVYRLEELDRQLLLCTVGGGGGGGAIRLYVKSQDPFTMSFKLKLRSFVSVPSLFKKDVNTFDSFGIE